MNARAALSVAILFLLTSLNGWAQQSVLDHNDNGSITVTVHSSTDQPVADARVEARELGTGRVESTGYTNSAGMVELPNIPTGSYEVVATSGLNEARERTERRMGDSMVSLRMPLQQAEVAAAGGQDSVSVAQFKVPKKAREVFHKAEEALHKRNIDDCKKEIAKALEIYPNFAEALTLRAVLAMDDQNRDAAIADLDASIKADPSYSLAYFVLGATYNSMSKFDDSIRVLERGISLAPQSWQGYFELGKSQIGKGSFESAVKTLDKAQSLAPPTYSLVHLVKAHALLGLQDYTSAMGELQAFLEKEPKDDAQAKNARDLLGKVQAFTASNQAR